MDVEKFKKSSSGRIVKSGQGNTAYWSYIPNPLPPDFVFDPELIRVLSDADRSLGELAGLGRSMPNPHLLIRPFIHREAVLSSRIEGTQADIADVYAFESGKTSEKAPAEADVKEVHNYVVALEYGIKRIEKLPVSLRLMRELHERLMKGVRGGHATPGDFRRTQNWIGPAGCTLNTASYVPPPVPEMSVGLDRLEKYIHADESHPPLVRIALIHYQFEAIHPFIDGNGRIGRLLISILLADWGLLPLPLLYLSAYIERNRGTYYDRLLAVSRTGAWREWLLFFLQGVTEQSKDAISRAKKLQDLQTGWREQLKGQKRLTGLILGIIDELFEKPVISAPEVAKKFKVSHQGAMKALQGLESQKIIKLLPGKQRNRMYAAKDVIKLME